MSVADEIEKLKSLEKAGIISADDFEMAKDRLISRVVPAPLEPVRTGPTWAGFSVFNEWVAYLVLGVVGLAAVGTTIVFFDAVLIAIGLGLLFLCLIAALGIGM